MTVLRTKHRQSSRDIDSKLLLVLMFGSNHKMSFLPICHNDFILSQGKHIYSPPTRALVILGIVWYTKPNTARHGKVLSRYRPRYLVSEKTVCGGGGRGWRKRKRKSSSKQTGTGRQFNSN